MSKKLLLADDSITIQKVVQITFAHEDYELAIADNGDSAFEKARELKPDLVMADVYMPGKNGYELCTALKQDPDCRNIPVLLLAGSFEPFDEDKARASQADAWLVKPFESQVLIDKVAELLAASPEVSTEADEQSFDPEPAVAEASTADEPSAEAMADPLGAISFDDELFSDDEALAAESDDWSDLGELVESHEVSAVSAAVEPGLTPSSQPEEAPDDFAGADEAEAEKDVVAGNEADAEEAIVAASPADEEMFIFEDEDEAELPAAAEQKLDVFAEDDDEIMPLDDDDILGFEDLEPLEEEQTLAAWSRDKVVASGEDEDLAVFDDDAEDDVVDVEPFPVPAESGLPLDGPDLPEEAPADDAPFEEVEPVVSSFELSEDLEPVAEFEPAVESGLPAEIEPEADFAPASEPIADESEDEFEIEHEVDAEVGSEVEAEAAALNEAEIEAIVEKVAGRVIEKLAGTILERIAWEVVPDLAEALIKEEISKIRDSAA